MQIRQFDRYSLIVEPCRTQAPLQIGKPFFGNEQKRNDSAHLLTKRAIKYSYLAARSPNPRAISFIERQANTKKNSKTHKPATVAPPAVP